MENLLEWDGLKISLSQTKESGDMNLGHGGAGAGQINTPKQ